MQVQGITLNSIQILKNLSCSRSPHPLTSGSLRYTLPPPPPTTDTTTAINAGAMQASQTVESIKLFKKEITTSYLVFNNATKALESSVVVVVLRALAAATRVQMHLVPIRPAVVPWHVLLTAHRTRITIFSPPLRHLETTGKRRASVVLRLVSAQQYSCSCLQWRMGLCWQSSTGTCKTSPVASIGSDGALPPANPASPASPARPPTHPLVRCGQWENVLHGLHEGSIVCTKYA